MLCSDEATSEALLVLKKQILSFSGQTFLITCADSLLSLNPSQDFRLENLYCNHMNTPINIQHLI